MLPLQNAHTGGVRKSQVLYMLFSPQKSKLKKVNQIIHLVSASYSDTELMTKAKVGAEALAVLTLTAQGRVAGTAEQNVSVATSSEEYKLWVFLKPDIR